MIPAPPASLSSSPASVAAWLLAAAGTVPFLAGVGDGVMFGGERLFVVQAYAAVIASFICGIHWGAALFAPQRRAIRLFIMSNIAALVSWLAALMPAGPGFLLFAATFATLLLVDRHLWRSGLWPDWFWRLRSVISGVVVGACLCIAIAGWGSA